MFTPDPLPSFTIWECDTLPDFIGELNDGERLVFKNDTTHYTGVVLSSKSTKPVAYVCLQADGSCKIYERKSS